MKPEAGSYPAYFDNYIKYVTQEQVMDAFNQTWTEISNTISGISEEQANYAYAEGKWTIKQVLIHMIDTERIFAYRALRFARKDPQQLLPYEEDLYAATAELTNRNLKDLMEEFDIVRKSSICLFKSFSDNTLLNAGKTAAGEITVLALGFTICGHALHHLKVLKERYLKSAQK